MSPTNEEKHREAYAAAADEVRALDPEIVASRCGMRWSPDTAPLASVADQADRRRVGTLAFEALGRPVSVSWPSLDFLAEHPMLQNFAWQLICLHYMRMATGRLPGTDWVSYRELPDGLFYADTITREVEHPLARLFASDAEAFRQAGRGLGGREVDLADAAVVFSPLPHVQVVFSLWLEDEEFPAKLSVLYERQGTANLPLQDLRILADMIGGGLKRGADPADGPQ
jgi:hypothetical protein